jgi:hypothetical protein
MLVLIGIVFGWSLLTLLPVLPDVTITLTPPHEWALGRVARVHSGEGRGDAERASLRGEPGVEATLASRTEALVGLPADPEESRREAP